MGKKVKVEKSKCSQGVFFHKQKGQHILKNPLIIDSIIEKSNIKLSDTVLEIGPGTGNLTAKLLEKANKVIVVEIDTRMIAELKKRFRTSQYYSKLKIIVGDVIKLDIPKFDLCVANLPYQISSPFIFKLLSHPQPFRACILMVQREFANRLYARPSDKCYCRLSVNCQMLAKVENIMKVGKNNFKPPPKVDSNVVKIQRRATPLDVDYVEWDNLIRICFVRKNKTLSSAFSSKTVLDVLRLTYLKQKNMLGDVIINKNQKSNKDFDIKEMIKNVLRKTGFDEKRSRTLSIQEFMMLLKSFNEVGVHFTGLEDSFEEVE